MSWFSDIVQDFYNMQVQLNQVTEAFQKAQKDNKALLQLIAELKKKPEVDTNGASREK